MTGNKLRGRFAALLAAAVTAGALLTPVAAHAAEPVIPSPDGLTELTAAASCWEVKQNNPQAADGVYWILTPAMTQAERFYCDQTTDGGGWLLVGRGREGWSVSTNGSGTPAEVRGAVTGQAAFAPKQLSGELIDQLNNDQPIKNLTDGIRLVRATNTAGTSWQDVRFTLSSPRDEWTWQFNNEQRVATYKIGNSTRTGGTTANFGSDNYYNRVRTITGSTEGWAMGFGFGSNVRGSTSATGYLWAKDTSTGYARPFTQVFIRPKLISSSAFSAIPASGSPAVTGESVASSFAEVQNWGVAGLGAGPSSLEGSNEVSAFAEVGSTVFVGGNFTTVQKTAGGGSAQAQSYLAAFQRGSAEFVPTFRPTFNNQVKALAALPGNRIAVGGYFTQVNGQAYAGLVVLDATTGAIDSSFTGRLINALSGSVPVVRTLDVQGDWLYVGGSFTHSTGGSSTVQSYTRAAARFSIASGGTPDGSWNPEFNGTVMSLDASARGDRVYFAGFFSQSQSRIADKGAAMSTTSTDLFPWNVVFSNRDGGRSGYQQAVLEVGDRVWLGGSEHSLFSYSRDDFSMLSSSIGLAGGDFQSIASDGNAVYGGCHCFETQYQGAKTWPSVGTSWTAADAVYGSGAWSASTGARIPSFNGTFNTRAGAGAWALFVDSTGTLWQGGDWSYSTRAGYVRQWSGGFIRHAQRDVTAPTTPTSPKATTGETGVTVTWGTSSDDRAVTGYQVLRNDRVVATVTGTSVVLPAAPTGTTYFVRAIDAAGNASASTASFTAVAPPVVPETTTLITNGSTWSYVYDTAGAAGAWTATGYDASAWQTGTAPLGWGQASLGTTLTAAAPKPLASFYRHSFDITDASTVESVKITTRADDGIVLYVNGTEVGRVNVNAGAAGVGTYANAAVSASSALANPVTITVPGYLFVDGTNVISASVHSNYRTTPSHSFELSAVATNGVQPDAPAEPAPETPAEPEPEPETPADPEPAVTAAIAADATWSYAFPSTAISADWAAAGFDDASWATGGGAFGWGHSSITTPLDTTLSPRPITSYYRHDLELSSTAFTTMSFTTRADDGIVVYVNGTEVARKNINQGTVTQGTYANTAVSASNAVANPFAFTVPASAFTTGTNVIAVEVHSNYRSTPSHSFALTATAS